MSDLTVTKTHQRFVALKEQYRETQRTIKTTEQSIKDYQKKHQETVEATDLLGRALETMKAALVPLTEAGLGRLKSLLTQGLQTIFYDRDYQVEIEISDRSKDKTAIIWLLETRGGEQLKVLLRDSVGGGVQSIAGLILQVFFILHYRMRRVLILDEPFGDLSDMYLDGVFTFLRYLANDLEFSFLIVSHDTKFYKFADTLYEVRGGTTKIRG